MQVTTEEKAVDEKEVTKDSKDEVSRDKRATVVRMDVDPVLEKAEVRTLVRSHMIRGIHLTTQFHDEQVIGVFVLMWFTFSIEQSKLYFFKIFFLISYN